MGKTGIIILEYNNFEDTLNCIASVLRHNTADVKFIIIDNASTDKRIVGKIKHGISMLFPDKDTKNIDNNNILPEITFIENETNDGYAAGNNIGLNYAFKDPTIEYILILNSDILFVEDIIPQLIKDINHQKDAAIISPLLYKKGLKEIDGNCARSEISNNEILLFYWPYPFDMFKIAQKRKIDITNKQGLIRIDIPSGSCMFGRKELFRSIGGFDSNTFLYLEEDILQEKIKKINLFSYIDTNIKCIHLGATSIKKRPSAFIANVGIESVYYFAKTYRTFNPLQKSVLYVFKKLNKLRITLSAVLQKFKAIEND